MKKFSAYFDFDKNPNLFRFIFLGLAVYLIFMVLITFYRFGSIPTDENWFTHSPSNFYVVKSFPAVQIKKNDDSSKAPLFEVDSIRAGNLVLAVNKIIFSKSDRAGKFYQSIPDDSVFTMTIFPLTERKTKYEYLVHKSTFPDSSVRMLPSAAYVWM